MDDKIRIMVTLETKEDEDPEMELTDMIISEIQELLDDYHSATKAKVEAVI